MAARNSNYWEKRFVRLEDSLHRKGLNCYAEIEQQYRHAELEIKTKMRAWYQRFADNNEILLADARKWLRGNDLAEFKWTVQDYIKAGEENALDGRWMKQLENASAKYHISWLESLEIEMQQSLEVMFGNQLDSLDAAIRKVYTDGYYHTAFEIQKGWGVGWDFAQLNERKIYKVIHKPWAADGKDFSERIWSNREKLVNELNRTLVQNLIIGEDPQKAINKISEKMEVSKRNAGRLVMTEEAYFASVSQADCFRELDVEQYQIVATLDNKTSEICQEMDSKIFKMSEREVGDTAPPFHPNCRSTTIPYFDEWYGLDRERAAREENGQTYTVPADMTYKEWKQRIDNGGFGLAAGENENSGVKPHDPPKLLEKIDMSDEEAVLSKLKEYELQIADSEIENAIVITKDGDVIQCFGVLENVYPNVDLGEQLRGAYVTHNHPRGATNNEYTFSDDDVSIFLNYDLKALRGIDDKYIYELTRNPSAIDELSEKSVEELDEYTWRHDYMIMTAQKYGIGYRRFKHE